MEDAEGNLNIYKICRKIKKMDQCLYNAVRSIYEDSLFVAEIRRLWPDLPLIANLRCGKWYSSQFEGTCYFKSTDGHTGNWSFNPTRLNMHIASLAAGKGGCIIVDATRKGKRFPDSMSKTIPIWTCVLNRAIKEFRIAKLKKSSKELGMNSCENSNGQVHCRIDCQLQHMSSEDNIPDLNICSNKTLTVSSSNEEWDCSLHLPLWVSETEKANIEEHIEGWKEILKATGTDISFLAGSLRRPLRPLWISQKTVIWLNEVPDLDSWNFTPIILVSASCFASTTWRTSDTDFSWSYIPGAGDDEESWARGLTPNLFWKHAYDIISGGPDACNRIVADIVEKDRVYRSQRGQEASQIRVKPQKKSPDIDVLLDEGSVSEYQYNIDIGSRFSCGGTIQKLDHGIQQSPGSHCGLYWVGSTKLAIGTTEYGRAGDSLEQVDSIINCDPTFGLIPSKCEGEYFHLPILSSKFDRWALQNNLSSAISFARKKLERGQTLLVCCSNGEDVSVCICLAILMSLFDDQGVFDGGRGFKSANVSKWDIRRQLVYICNFVSNARPSRGNIRQVFNFLRWEH